MTSPSSCPVCLARADPIFLIWTTATECQPPKLSARLFVSEGTIHIQEVKQSKWRRNKEEKGPERGQSPLGGQDNVVVHSVPKNLFIHTQTATSPDLVMPREERLK